jgi:hypothetical protein
MEQVVHIQHKQLLVLVEILSVMVVMQPLVRVTPVVLVVVVPEIGILGPAAVAEEDMAVEVVDLIMETVEVEVPIIMEPVKQIHLEQGQVLMDK